MQQPHRPADYFSTLKSDYFGKSSDFWGRSGEEKALQIFHQAAVRVPAYKDFLCKNKVAPEKILTYRDLQYVPPTSKKNYIREYPLTMLCWDGTLKDKAFTFTTSSGSTGEPTYFVRDEKIDWQSSVMHEIFLRNINGGTIPPTLVIDAFAMGMWIGGQITYLAFHKIAQRNNAPITVMTTGLDKKEILRGVRTFGSTFEQVILCGYPPFIKDVINDGIAEGIDWKSIPIKFVFAAEAFGEEFRQFIYQTVGVSNPYSTMTNIYGTADLGTMAMETPLSIAIRNMTYQNQELKESIFPEVYRTPTLTQFNPLFIQFEDQESNLLCTADNGIPFVRYSLGDHGGVTTYSKMSETFQKHNLDLLNETEKLGVRSPILEWPFVFVYERADFSTKLYGVIIYPEHVREALLRPDLQPFLTGKFTLETKFNEDHNQYLDIHLELKDGVREHDSIKGSASKAIVDHLMIKNPQYRYLSSTVDAHRVHPNINLSHYGDEHSFKSGTKHRWIKQ